MTCYCKQRSSTHQAFGLTSLLGCSLRDHYGNKANCPIFVSLPHYLGTDSRVVITGCLTVFFRFYVCLVFHFIIRISVIFFACFTYLNYCISFAVNNTYLLTYLEIVCKRLKSVRNGQKSSVSG